MVQEIMRQAKNRDALRELSSSDKMGHDAWNRAYNYMMIMMDIPEADKVIVHINFIYPTIL